MPNIVKIKNCISEKERQERNIIIYSQNFLKKPELVQHLLEKSLLENNLKGWLRI